MFTTTTIFVFVLNVPFFMIYKLLCFVELKFSYLLMSFGDLYFSVIKICQGLALVKLNTCLKRGFPFI